MSRDLNDLCFCIAKQAEEFLHRASTELNFEMVVVDVKRDALQQALNIANGVSWTSHSLHLPQPICGRSHALDAAPAHLMKLPHWAPEHPDWKRLRDLAVECGLSCGFDWKRTPDRDHYQVNVKHKFTDAPRPS